MKSKKVFVVKKFKSPYIEEAIFILKEDAPSDTATKDAVEEAERLVTGYLAGLSCPLPPKKKRRLLVPFLLGLICATAMWLLIR